MRQAAVKLDSWLDGSDQAERWRAYLRSDLLQEQIALGAGADPAVVESVLTRFSSQAPGLDLPVFYDVRDTLVAWRARLLGPSKAELADAIRAAKANFQPVTEAQVEQAKAAALPATRALEQFLASEENGAGWRNYLLLGKVEQQLMSDSPELAVFDQAETKAAVGRQALTQGVFRSYADKLHHFAARLRVFSEDRRQERYERVLEVLAEALGEYEKDHSDKAIALIGQGVDLLEEREQAPLLTAALRRYYWEPYPNLFIELSARLATEGFNEKVDEVRSIEDFIDGAHVVGTGHTRGELVASLKPNESLAELQDVFTGRVHSNTTAYASQAIVRSLSVTDFNATKRLSFDVGGFHGEYPSAHACSHGQPYCVTAIIPNKSCSKLHQTEISQRLQEKKRQLLQPIADRIAWKQVLQRQGRTDYLASRSAERRIAEQFEKRLAESVQQADDAYQNLFRKPLMRRGAFPERIEFSTTAAHLRIVAQKARGPELSALEPPPEGFSGADLMLRMHESMFNNMARAWFGGRTLTREQMFEEFSEFLRTPLTPPQRGAAWKITFAEEDPVLVQLRGGHMRITFHGERFSFEGGQTFNQPMVIVVDTVPTIDERGGLRLVRGEGGVEAWPPGVDPKTAKLSITEAQLKKDLEESFSKSFERTKSRENGNQRVFGLPKRWRSAGELRLREVRSEDRWLSLGYFLDSSDSAEDNVAPVPAP